MTARRILVALSLALLLSGGLTLWLGRSLGRKAGAPMPTRSYVAAARNLEAGEVLKPDALKVVQWPITIPLQGATGKVEELLGRSVMYPIGKDEPLVSRQLAPAGSGIGLAAKIPEGMRAISVRSDDIVGVAGFLLPGTRVDVLVTYRASNSPLPATATVVQDVEVLAAGHQIQPDPDGKPSSVNVVTLLLDPQNAEKIVLASSQGSIQFVLRNGADRAKAETAPVTTSELTTTPRSEAESATRPARLTSVRPHSPKSNLKAYVVETILGNKKIDTSVE